MSRLLHKVIEKPEDCPYREGFGVCRHPNVETRVPIDFFAMVCDEKKTGEFPRLCLLKPHLEGEKKKIATDIHNFLMGNVTGREMLGYTFEACQETGSSELSYLFDYYNKHHTPEATFEDFKNAWEVEP